jgi:hypothetical protein
METSIAQKFCKGVERFILRFGHDTFREVERVSTSQNRTVIFRCWSLMTLGQWRMDAQLSYKVEMNAVKPRPTSGLVSQSHLIFIRFSIFDPRRLERRYMVEKA